MDEHPPSEGSLDTDKEAVDIEGSLTVEQIQGLFEQLWGERGCPVARKSRTSDGTSSTGWTYWGIYWY